MKREELEALSTSQLDEMVHDAKSDEAASINNQGREEQIAYLLGEVSKPAERIFGLSGRSWRAFTRGGDPNTADHSVFVLWDQGVEAVTVGTDEYLLFEEEEARDMLGERRRQLRRIQQLEDADKRASKLTELTAEIDSLRKALKEGESA